jgi:hypothetical protein
MTERADRASKTARHRMRVHPSVTPRTTGFPVRVEALGTDTRKTDPVNAPNN